MTTKELRQATANERRQGGMTKDTSLRQDAADAG